MDIYYYLPSFPFMNCLNIIFLSMTNSSIEKKVFLSPHNSRLHSNTVGKKLQHQEFERAGHITFTTKRREKGHIHAPPNPIPQAHPCLCNRTPAAASLPCNSPKPTFPVDPTDHTLSSSLPLLMALFQPVPPAGTPANPQVSQGRKPG